MNMEKIAAMPAEDNLTLLYFYTLKSYVQALGSLNRKFIDWWPLLPYQLTQQDVYKQRRFQPESQCSEIKLEVVCFFFFFLHKA